MLVMSSLLQETRADGELQVILLASKQQAFTHPCACLYWRCDGDIDAKDPSCAPTTAPRDTKKDVLQ